MSPATITPHRLSPTINPDDERDLLAHRRCPDELPRLEILQVVVRDRRAREHDRRKVNASHAEIMRLATVRMPIHNGEMS